VGVDNGHVLHAGLFLSWSEVGMSAQRCFFFCCFPLSFAGKEERERGQQTIKQRQEAAVVWCSVKHNREAEEDHGSPPLLMRLPVFFFFWSLTELSLCFLVFFFTSLFCCCSFDGSNEVAEQVSFSRQTVRTFPNSFFSCLLFLLGWSSHFTVHSYLNLLWFRITFIRWFASPKRNPLLRRIPWFLHSRRRVFPRVSFSSPSARWVPKRSLKKKKKTKTKKLIMREEGEPTAKC
jgi:hypothetical protein